MFEKLLAERHIAALDLDAVRLNVIQDLGWTTEKTTQVELEYRRFLYALIKKEPGILIAPPSDDVDQFWHRHILSTRRYREDCDKVFGRYIDHTPGLTAEEQGQADENRRRVYANHQIDAISFRSGRGYDGGGEYGGDDGGDVSGPSNSSHHSHESHGSDGGDEGSGHAASGHDGSTSDGGGHSGGEASGSDGGSSGGDGGDGGGGDGGGGDGGGGDGGGRCGGGCGGE